MQPAGHSGCMDRPLYRVELFIQGRGWRPLNEVYRHSGVTRHYSEALKLGLAAILARIGVGGGSYGARLGDPVGFRVSETHEGVPSELTPESAEIRWEDYSHLFYVRGSVYMLYKSWSWPD